MAEVDFPPGWRLTQARLLGEGIGGRVWEALAPDGACVVAKRVSKLAALEAHRAVAFLRWRDGTGAVRLLAAEGPWQLLEHAGDTTLLDVLDRNGDEKAAVIACGVAAALHAPSERAPPQLQGLNERFASLLNRKPGSAPEEMEAVLAEGAVTAERLLASQAGMRPLHGDIHHGNIMLGSRGWLAIDPHGLFGDPGYDLANLFYNPVERPALRTSEARIARLAAQIEQALGTPRERCLDWGMAHACLSASWHLEDGNGKEARASLDVAAAIRLARG